MRRWNSLFLLIFTVTIFVGCSHDTPKQEDFDFSVVLNKTEFAQGETIEYTVKLTRITGSAFQFQGSSTLCCACFEPIGIEPYYNRQDDVVTHRIDSNYEYEKTNVIRTESYEPGQYLLSIRFYLGQLKYDFSQEITISDGTLEIK